MWPHTTIKVQNNTQVFWFMWVIIGEPAEHLSRFMSYLVVVSDSLASSSQTLCYSIQMHN